MLTTLALSLVLSGPLAADLSCPVMGSAIPAKAKGLDYAGVRYLMCCGGCDAPFKADPAKYVKAKEGKVIGLSLFDPVAGTRVDAKKVAGTVDYKGVRFQFANKENMATFNTEPAKFGAIPAKEVLFCTVMGHGIANYAEAGAYVDHEGVRYYMCCGDCSGAFKKDAATFAAKNADKVKAPVARTYKQ